jgi:hypothetical protein
LPKLGDVLSPLFSLGHSRSRFLGWDGKPSTDPALFSAECSAPLTGAHVPEEARG